MNVLKIVEAWLKSNGYDGLYSDNYECSCEAGDLAPCESIGDRCNPGYRVWGCNSGCGQGCDFHIEPDKPAK